MAKKFKPNVGTKISKKDAMEWIDKYDKEMRKDKLKDTKSIFYGRDMLLRILSEEGSAGITCFFALRYNEDVKKETLQLVLVPTREDGTHIWSEETTVAKEKGKSAIGKGGGAVAFDGGVQCPPYC
jgi:hypothetical protein